MKCYDPIPKGAECQRLEPPVEWLVFQAEQVGRLTEITKHLQEKLLQKTEEIVYANTALDESRRKLEYTRSDLSRVTKERDSALRRIPKKPKAIKKGKK